MNLKEFVDVVVDQGIEAVKRDYARPDQKKKRDGSIAGFEECRDKDPDELKLLLETAAIAREDARENDKDGYWWYRCYEAEVEWVCNCVSVLLMQLNQPTIIIPTARAAIHASRIVGVTRP